MIEEKGKSYYVLIKNFNTFICNNKLNILIKNFCKYFLQTFSTKELPKSHVNKCFKINGKINDA